MLMDVKPNPFTLQIRLQINQKANFGAIYETNKKKTKSSRAQVHAFVREFAALHS